MAISPDEKIVYMQLSFLHGFVEFDLATEKPRAIAELPICEEAQTTPRENYLLDSAHHGLAINPDGTKLCAAGTMSDYAAIVHHDDFEFTDRRHRARSPTGRPTAATAGTASCPPAAPTRSSSSTTPPSRRSAEIPVGDHPQRMRMGLIRSEFLKAGAAKAASSASPRGVPNLQVLRARTRGGALDLKLRISSRAKGALRATYTAGGQRSQFSIKVPNRATGTALWTLRRELTARQRSARTGTLDLRFAGNSKVLPDRTTIRTAAVGADLRTTSTSINTDTARLKAAGTISRRARGEAARALRLPGGDRHARALPELDRAGPQRPLLARRGAAVARAARAGGHLTLEYAR